MTDTDPTDAAAPKREGARTHRRRRLDRLVEHSRNRKYPVRVALAGRELTRTRISWTPGPVLDQGEDGACVAFGWTQEALSQPVAVDLSKVLLPGRWPFKDPNRFARRLYFAVQRHDQWAGGAYPNADPVYEGTSVVAGAKQMQRLGFLGEYRWAFNVHELADGLLALGPAVIGVGWRDSMFDPDPDTGVLHVAGDAVGGHCVAVTAYEPDRDLGNGPEGAFRITNSWGADWGVGGHAWLAANDMQLLLDDDGDACIPVERHFGTMKAA